MDAVDEAIASAWVMWSQMGEPWVCPEDAPWIIATKIDMMFFVGRDEGEASEVTLVGFKQNFWEVFNPQNFVKMMKNGWKDDEKTSSFAAIFVRWAVPTT